VFAHLKHVFATSNLHTLSLNVHKYSHSLDKSDNYELDCDC
jgi:hypothetical protein